MRTHGFIGRYPGPNRNQAPGMWSPREIVDLMATNEWPQVSPETPWSRPAAWLSMPGMSAGVQKFAGLLAIIDDGGGNANWVCLHAQANYTVDWGDGSATENLSALSVTFTDAGDLVNLNSHGLAAGTPVTFSVITTTTGITVQVTYIVINPTANNFQLATSPTGAALPLASDGSGTMWRCPTHHYVFSAVSSATTAEGWKQVIVTIIPNGGNLTLVDLQRKYPFYLASQIMLPWLDIEMNGASLTVFNLSMNGTVLRPNLLRKVSIGENAIANFTYMFNGCSSLSQVSVAGTGTATNFSNMFNGCTALLNAPALDLTRATDLSYMFTVCYSLQYVPDYTLKSSGKITVAYMFNNCYNLATAPTMNTSQVTDVNHMFNNCYALTFVPLYNLSAATSTGYMFSNCRALEQVPQFDLSASTDMSYMFSGCSLLTTVPVFAQKQSGTINFTYMFQNCYAMRIAPSIDVSRSSNCSYMFYQCTSLERAPSLSFPSTAGSLSHSNMFYGCSAMRSIPSWNLGGSSDLSNFCYGCSALSSVAGQSMPSGGTSFSAANMFYGCFSLTDIPTFSFTKASSLSSTFQNCYSLKAYGDIVASAATTYQSAFQGCYGLMSVGQFNMTAATSATDIFTDCWAMTNFRPVACKAAVGLTNTRFFQGDMEHFFTSLVKATAPGSTAITISTSSVPTATASARACGTTANSATVTCTNTAGIVQGLYVTGTEVTGGKAVTFTDVGDIVTLTSHTLQIGTPISFSSITSTTGIVVYIMYAVINPQTNTFQVVTPVVGTITDSGDWIVYTNSWANGDSVYFCSVGKTTGLTAQTRYYIINRDASRFNVSTTPGGSIVPLTGDGSCIMINTTQQAAMALTTNGSGTMLIGGQYVTGVTTNTSFTMNVMAHTTNAAASLTFRALNSTMATLRGFTITG